MAQPLNPPSKKIVEQYARLGGESQPVDTWGIPDEYSTGTEEYDARVQQLEDGLNVLVEYQSGNTVYSYIYQQLVTYRDFYLGKQNQQFNQAFQEEGDIRVPYNLGATVIDLFTYILSNRAPFVQFVSEDATPLAQLRADIAEDITSKILYESKFHQNFRDAAKTQFLMGFTYLMWYWNPDNKAGGKKGTLEMTILNAFTTRVKFASNDYKKIESYITVRRLSHDEIAQVYNFEAVPDMEDRFIPKSIIPIDDGKTSVFRQYHSDYISTVINGRCVKKEKNKYGFVPIQQINNIIVPNDAFGHSEIERWQPILQEVNAILSAASEIARDLAYPPILEYNNALGGRKIPKWRGNKIPVRRSPDKGEAVSFMQNPAQIQPLLKQAQTLLELFYFVSLMPKAAAGVFDTNVTSGFQAKLAMNPATLTTESRKIDWNVALIEMVRMAFKIIRVEDPDVFKMDIEDDRANMDDLENQTMEIVWPDTLPMDIAREIQNLVLGVQQGLTSVTQAIDKYGALMGTGSATDTEEYLKQESKDIELAPDRVGKVAKAQMAMAQIKQLMAQAQAQLATAQGQMGGGQTPGAATPPGSQGGQGSQQEPTKVGIQVKVDAETPVGKALLVNKGEITPEQANDAQDFQEGTTATQMAADSNSGKGAPTELPGAQVPTGQPGMGTPPAPNTPQVNNPNGEVPQLGGGEQIGENPTNDLRAAASPLPEQQGNTGGLPENLPASSTGGVVPNGGKL